MKIKKVLISIVMLVVGLLLTNQTEVQAKDTLYQAWVIEDGGSKSVLYRTYTTPHGNTVTAYNKSYKKTEVVCRPGTAKAAATYYLNDKYIESRWVYDLPASANSEPDNSHFQTYGLLFYGDRDTLVGQYGGTGTSYAYATFNCATSDVSSLNNNLYPALTLHEISSINGIRGGIKAYTWKPITDDKIAYKIPSDLVPYTNADPFYRMAIVSATEGSKHNIYVTDRELEKDVVSTIEKGANEKDLFFAYGEYKKCLRVSNMLRSEINSSGEQASMKTPWQFYNKGNSWSASSHGLTDSGDATADSSLGSVINLYDNILIFPEGANRKVKYRFVNIGEEEIISTVAVENAEKGQYKVLDLDSENNGKVIRKAEGTPETGVGKEYLGYNFAIMETEEKAKKVIDTKVASKTMDSTETEYVTPKYEQEKDEVIIVEMYYRDNVNAFNEIHTYYDESGNPIADLQVRKQYDTDDSGEYIKDGSKRVVHKLDSQGFTGEDIEVTELNEDKYGYIGAVKTNSADTPSISAYVESQDSLELVINDTNDANEYKYGYFAYKKTSNVIERHIMYTINPDTSVSTADIVEPKTHNVITPISLVRMEGYDYLGVQASDSNVEPVTGSYSNKATSYQIDSGDSGMTVFFGYKQENVEINVREILYDADGLYLRTLSQYKTAASLDFDSNVTISTNASRYSSYKYKGNIKTYTDDKPSLLAYKNGTDCTVTGREVARQEIWVNFLYQIKPTIITLPKGPTIDVNSKLDFEMHEAPSMATTTNTTACESSVYKEEQWDKILSVPTSKNISSTPDKETRLRFGIIALPKYILGAVKTRKDDVENGSATGNLYVYTVVTAKGLKNKDTNEQRSESLPTVSTFSVEFPIKSASYKLVGQKIYKLDDSTIYAPGFSHPKTVGNVMFGSTENYPVSYKNYTSVKVTASPDSPASAGVTSVETDFYIDPSYSNIITEGSPSQKYSETFENMERQTITSGALLDIKSVINTIITLDDTMKTLLGFNGTPGVAGVVFERVTVYTSGTDEEDLNYGNSGAYRYEVTTKNGEKKDVYRDVENKFTWDQAASNFWEKLKEFMVKIINFIVGLFTETDPGFEYDPDMEKGMLLGLASNVIQDLNGKNSFIGSEAGVRDILYKMNLYLEKNEFVLELNDERIAYNSGIDFSVEVDSCNFSPDITSESLNAGVKGTFKSIIDAKDYVADLINTLPLHAKIYRVHFDGYLDCSQIGVLKITPIGKTYYTEGFVPITDLADENTIKASGDYLTDVVAENAKNGIRLFAADTTYKPEVDNPKEHDSSFNADYILDNLYYSTISTRGKVFVFEASKSDKYTKKTDKDKTYKVPGNDKKAVEIVNVYTPIRVKGGLLSDLQEDEPESQLIGKYSESGITSRLLLETGFKFNIGVEDYSSGKYTESTVPAVPFELKEYLKYYYLKFDFDIKELMVENDTTYAGITVNGNPYNSGDIVPANTWIRIKVADLVAVPDIGNLLIKAKATEAVVGKASYTVRALAKNIEELEKPSLKTALPAFYNTYRNICNDNYPSDVDTEVKADSPVYYDEKKIEIIIKDIERLYDFEVTDVKDLDWKNVFRTGTNSTDHNEKKYFSGSTRWVQMVKQPVGRTSAQLGSNPSRLLPVGPFKHTDTTYKSAPKMGYRISYDVKLTGDYNDSKEVIIKPSFYYISKDGITFKDDSEINLYYKNQAGNYVKIGTTEDKYELKFIPNDGYRHLESSGAAHLSDKQVSLGQLKNIILKADGMSTSTLNYMVFYGEYKLPNTTIAINDGASINNSSSYLKNGYIGVKFDITYRDPTISALKDPTISYGVGMLKTTTGTTMTPVLGTSQWDFESYLGMKYKNTSKTVKLKLEQGTWTIDRDTYEKIKGTVVLFDLDSRASSDFN